MNSDEELFQTTIELLATVLLALQGAYNEYAHLPGGGGPKTVAILNKAAENLAALAKPGEADRTLTMLGQKLSEATSAISAEPRDEVETSGSISYWSVMAILRAQLAAMAERKLPKASA